MSIAISLDVASVGVAGAVFACTLEGSKDSPVSAIHNASVAPSRTRAARRFFPIFLRPSSKSQPSSQVRSFRYSAKPQHTYKGSHTQVAKYQLSVETHKVTLLLSNNSLKSLRYIDLD